MSIYEFWLQAMSCYAKKTVLLMWEQGQWEKAQTLEQLVHNARNAQ
jgi:hypothetical protein